MMIPSTTVFSTPPIQVTASLPMQILVSELEGKLSDQDASESAYSPTQLDVRYILDIEGDAMDEDDPYQ
mgnify:CR=1 FL=1